MVAYLVCSYYYNDNDTPAAQPRIAIAEFIHRAGGAMLSMNSRESAQYLRMPKAARKLEYAFRSVSGEIIFDAPAVWLLASGGEVQRYRGQAQNRRSFTKLGLPFRDLITPRPERELHRINYEVYQRLVSFDKYNSRTLKKKGRARFSQSLW